MLISHILGCLKNTWQQVISLFSMFKLEKIFVYFQCTYLLFIISESKVVTQCLVLNLIFKRKCFDFWSYKICWLLFLEPENRRRSVRENKTIKKVIESSEEESEEEEEEEEAEQEEKEENNEQAETSSPKLVKKAKFEAPPKRSSRRRWFKEFLQIFRINILLTVLYKYIYTNLCFNYP